MITAERPILVTGGAGFIGSNFILDWFAERLSPIINVDKLTYAGHPGNLASLAQDPAYLFVRGDIVDSQMVSTLLDKHRPRAVVNFAAESHVDRSIDSPANFITTNVVGTFQILDCARAYHQSLDETERDSFRFLHVSTDEVYGSIEPDGIPFSETTPYDPKSPYSASKAASDHLVRAWHHTYGLPILITNCSNNYGPFQFPEKLIPLAICNALNDVPIPVYGDGKQIRDWLYVGDHCAALRIVLERGQVGATYNIGGWNEKANIDVVESICRIVDRYRDRTARDPRRRLITFVKDRPGHDRRYAVNASKIMRELSWTPQHDFDTGLEKTISWYIENEPWVRSVATGEYRQWISRQYGSCLPTREAELALT